MESDGPLKLVLFIFHNYIRIPMRNLFLLLILFFRTTLLNAQSDPMSVEIIINKTQKTQLMLDGEGLEKIIINQKDWLQFENDGFIRYSDLGATGDGVTDDMIFIKATHAVANEYEFAVKADDGALYYISGKENSAVIHTDTDFGNATFLIDDVAVENINTPIFKVRSRMNPVTISGLNQLKKNQKITSQFLPEACIVATSDDKVKRYIRYGLNQNKGRSQTDIFLMDKNGKIDSLAPIIWDFDHISEITALPIDQKKLIINGGKFITISNQAPSKYTYYSRNIDIRRSNSVIQNLKHFIKGEGEHGAPYRGFISISDCSNVLVKDCVMTGHKTYRTIGAAGKPVFMGSYDLSVSRAINISFVNCRQTNDINDNSYWGLFASNYSKNISFDHCVFSRFDAHMGVYNATIRNSTLGYMGINAIGSGKFVVENSTIYGRSLVNLRQDYGSTWEGTFLIKNCVFVPSKRNSGSVSLFSGANSGMHDFGYTCHMPKNIIIEQLHIDDSNLEGGNNSISLFANFNPKMINENFKEDFPYIRTQKVTIKDLTISSNQKLKVSENQFMFKDLKITMD